MLLIFCRINEKNRRSFDLRLLESVTANARHLLQATLPGFTNHR